MAQNTAHDIRNSFIIQIHVQIYLQDFFDQHISKSLLNPNIFRICVLSRECDVVYMYRSIENHWLLACRT